MPMTTSQTSIINRGLQILGYKGVSSINDNDRGARAMLRAYDSRKVSLLRAHPWNFAIKRASLPASAVAPIHTKGNAYPLPPDFLDLLPTDQSFGVSSAGNQSGPPNITDWQIEGNQIVSDMSSPLLIRYISSSVLESLFDSCFAEALAADLAYSCCEELTQSNTKLQNCMTVYDLAIALARKRNAFENRPAQPPLDNFIAVRF